MKMLIKLLQFMVEQLKVAAFAVPSGLVALLTAMDQIKDYTIFEMSIVCVLLWVVIQGLALACLAVATLLDEDS